MRRRVRWVDHPCPLENPVLIRMDLTELEFEAYSERLMAALEVVAVEATVKIGMLDVGNIESLMENWEWACRRQHEIVGAELQNE